MKPVLLALATLLAAGSLLAGCEPAPSTKVAPDVKEPDNRNVSGAEILKRKLGSDPKTGQ